jgi:hypothetical protein
MWVTLFAITLVAATGFAAAAVWRSRREFRSFLAEVADILSAGAGTSLGEPALGDDGLLIERMKSLRIDVGETVRTEPMLFRSLMIRCWGCESKAQCRRDLCTASASEEWKDYCPNASTLNAISTSYGVGCAAPAAADGVSIIDGR